MPGHTIERVTFKLADGDELKTHGTADFGVPRAGDQIWLLNERYSVDSVVWHYDDRFVIVIVRDFFKP